MTTENTEIKTTTPTDDDPMLTEHDIIKAHNITVVLRILRELHNKTWTWESYENEWVWEWELIDLFDSCRAPDDLRSALRSAVDDGLIERCGFGDRQYRIPMPPDHDDPRETQ